MDCIFCRIADGSLPSTRILETDDIVAFRDLAPQAPTHILVIPKKHVTSVAELGAEDTDLAGSLLRVAAEVARLEGAEDAGYRIVTNVGVEGGQTVGHLHLHLLAGRSMRWPPG